MTDLTIKIDYAHRHKLWLDKQLLAYILLDKTADQPDMSEIEKSDKVTFILSYTGKRKKKKKKK